MIFLEICCGGYNLAAVIALYGFITESANSC
nr:MAG TPA: hypothetical protein [Caudoviricetes sp.]